MPQHGLSSKTTAVLELIASGCSYEQILAARPDLTYLNIFHAAEETLDLFARGDDHRAYTVAEKHRENPQAYEKWTDKDDATLRELAGAGWDVSRIAERLQRNQGAIVSRLAKLGIVAANRRT